jgi:hypothetical protein
MLKEIKPFSEWREEYKKSARKDSSWNQIHAGHDKKKAEEHKIYMRRRKQQQKIETI